MTVAAPGRALPSCGFGIGPANRGKLTSNSMSARTLTSFAVLAHRTAGRAALRRSVLGFVAAFVVACVVVADVPSAEDGDASEPAVPMKTVLACLTPGVIETVKLIPFGMSWAYKTCGSELHADLGSHFDDLDESGRELVFASIVAHEFASYGTSYKVCLRDIVTEQHLACDNYAYLTMQLVKLLPMPPPSGAVRMLGFDHGTVGNHAQLFLVDGRLPVMVDPTIGLVAATSLEGLLTGVPVAANDLVSFYAWADPYIRDVFVPRVYNSVHDGLYRPDDVIYDVLPEDVIAQLCGP